MKVVQQTIEGVLGSLRSLDVDWQDDIAVSIISTLATLPIKQSYTRSDAADLLLAKNFRDAADQILAKNFNEGLLVAGLFLGLSKDQFTSKLRDELGGLTPGVNAYQSDPEAFLAALERLGLLEAMKVETQRQLHWTDRLVERLRSGRGSAISGQRRGRNMEDCVEALIKSIFGDNYESRCNFTGARQQTAKCDFAIPNKLTPQIVVESKAYAATGSKMTDVIGDIQKIISAKRSDTVFLFVTDGLTWRSRKSDLGKIIDYQNHGDIMRIYTLATLDQLEKDLATLRGELGL